MLGFMPVYIDKNLMAPARIINKPDFVIICYYLLLFCGFWVGVVFFCYYFVDFGLGLWSFLERKSEGKKQFLPARCIHREGLQITLLLVLLG